MIEKDFVTEGLKRTRIDEYLEKELERAGYGGMDVQITPLGTMVVVYAERPGMVIGRGGKNVRAITNTLKNDFGLDNPQIEVKEVSVPELNPKIMAYKIANMLQRGMHFRRVAYSTIRRIMGAGAQGVEVTISGKIRGSRSAVAKFVEGYIKKCGEPSIRLVEEGFATVQLKPGVLGIYVRIMPPETVLPDSVTIVLYGVALCYLDNSLLLAIFAPLYLASPPIACKPVIICLQSSADISEGLDISLLNAPAD